jgi:DNA-binding FadR family transcriptional regulator
VNEVRTAVEVQTAGLAAQRAQPEDLQRLRQLCDNHQASLEKGDLNAASEFDFQFHRELTRASGNELLLAMLDSISDVLREVRHQAMVLPHVGDDGLKAHRRILKVVSAGDPSAARDAMAKHLADAERVWREANAAVKAPGKAAKVKNAKQVPRR